MPEPITWDKLPPLTVLTPEEELVAWAALEQVLSGREVAKETLERPSYKRIREELRTRLSETVAIRLQCLRGSPGCVCDKPDDGVSICPIHRPGIAAIMQARGLVPRKA